METLNRQKHYFRPPPLYSLEKLIEWKHLALARLPRVTRTLYSLEKLIEWKQPG